MVLIASLAFPVPIVLAVLLGLWAGRSDPQTPRDFWIAAAWAVAWQVAAVFLWHALWVTSLLPASWLDTFISAGSWTLGTGLIWLPLLMITIVLRAMKARRE